MSMVKRKAFLAGCFLLGLWLPLTVLTQTDPACSPPIASCAPCGYVSGELGPIPSYAPGLNPLINYTASAEICQRSGFFGGPYVGAAYGLGDIHYRLQVAGRKPLQLDNDDRSYSETDWFAGYNLILDCFFLGAEVGYHYRSRNNPISYIDPVSFVAAQSVNPALLEFVAAEPCRVRLDINSQHAVSADLLPGFVFSRFVAYLRLGVESTKYEWDRRVDFPSIALNNVTSPFAANH